MRSSEEGNVILDLVCGQARSILETAKGRDSREDRIRLQLLSTKPIPIPGSVNHTWVPPSPGSVLYQRPW
jgi:hypothetical protein